MAELGLVSAMLGLDHREVRVEAGLPPCHTHFKHTPLTLKCTLQQEQRCMMIRCVRPGWLYAGGDEGAHTHTHTPLSGDSSYLCIYTFMSCCWTLKRNTHTLRVSSLCGGLDDFGPRLALWLEPRWGWAWNRQIDRRSERLGCTQIMTVHQSPPLAFLPHRSPNPTQTHACTLTPLEWRQDVSSPPSLSESLGKVFTAEISEQPSFTGWLSNEHQHETER